MTGSRSLLIGLGVWLLLLSGTAGAQQPGESLGTKAQRAGLGPRAGGIPGVKRNAGRANVGTHATKQFRGARSRLDELRGISPLAAESLGLLPDPLLPLSPIQLILERRNLLRVRSPLGRVGTMFLGRSEMGASKNGLPGMAWPVSPTAGRLATSAPTSDAADAATEPSGEARPPVRFEDAIAERLNKRAEEEFELGIAYFREGDLIQARDHFDLTKNLWLDQARPHVASMVVSFQAQNYYQAVNDELRALQLAKTLDDLRIDGFVDKFYSGSDPQKKQQAFNRTVELVNRMVQGAPDTSLARVLLAHYSWVNGDLSTAVSAADAVARTAPEPNAGYVRKFRDMLVEEQQAGEAKATTQPAAR